MYKQNLLLQPQLVEEHQELILGSPINKPNNRTPFNILHKSNKKFIQYTFKKVQSQQKQPDKEMERITTFPSRITSSPSTQRGLRNPGSASLPCPLYRAIYFPITIYKEEK